MLKIVSVTTAPEIRIPKSSAITVTTVIRLLRSAWLQTTFHSLIPFARAVRT